MGGRRPNKSGGYEVYEGEALPEIARDFGVPVKSLFDANPALKKARPNYNLLAPGEDAIKTVPPKPKQARGGTGGAVVGQTHEPIRVLRLRLLDSDGKALANLACTFAFGTEKEERLIRTDGQGEVTLSLPEEPRSDLSVPRDLRAILRVGQEPATHLFDLRIRHLRPLLEVSARTRVCAIKQRLRNLGYAVTDPHADNPQGVLDASTRVALACFQADQGLEVTGDADDRTLKSLQEAHGC